MGANQKHRAWLLPGGLVLFALVVRWVYLWQATGNPTFEAPIIDAARYDELARRILAEGRLEAELFWQPSFYPLWLSLVYWILGPSLLAAKLLEMGLAGLTCLCTYRLGGLVGARAGLGAHPTGALAAGAYALYGPSIFFEGELLATGFATLFLVALPLVALRAEESRRVIWWLGAGMVGGLAIWCRPEHAIAVALVSAWLLWRLVRWTPGGTRWEAQKEARSGARIGAPAKTHTGLRGRVAGSAVLGLSLAAGLAAIFSPVALLTARHTGRATALPFSGGLNLWLGNAPNLCETLTIRPGERWNQMVNEPLRERGMRTPWEQERFFVTKTLDAARDSPDRALVNLGRKSLRLVATREIPRNVDLYAARDYSTLLSGLAFRVGGFGFPFGVLLPLAVLGLVVVRRKIPAPVLLSAAGLALALVAVFPAARYRVPMVPLLAILGALGALALLQARRTGRWRPLWPGAAVALCILLLGILPGRFCEEQGFFAAELHLGAGAYLERQGRNEEARGRYEEAVRREPRLHAAQVNLGAILLRQGDGGAALGHFEAAVALEPQSAPSRLGRALSLTYLDRIPEAIRDLRVLVRLEPRAPGHWFLLGQAQARAGLYLESYNAFRTANRLRPNDPETLNALAWLASGRDDPALARPEDAVRLAERACELTGHRDPSLLDTLAVALEAAGRPEEARDRYHRAATLALEQGKHDLARQIQGRLAKLPEPANSPKVPKASP